MTYLLAMAAAALVWAVVVKHTLSRDCHPPHGTATRAAGVERHASVAPPATHLTSNEGNPND